MRWARGIAAGGSQSLVFYGMCSRVRMGLVLSSRWKEEGVMEADRAKQKIGGIKL